MHCNCIWKYMTRNSCKSFMGTKHRKLYSSCFKWSQKKKQKWRKKRNAMSAVSDISLTMKLHLKLIGNENIWTLSNNIYNSVWNLENLRHKEKAKTHFSVVSLIVRHFFVCHCCCWLVTNNPLFASLDYEMDKNSFCMWLPWWQNCWLFLTIQTGNYRQYSFTFKFKVGIIVESSILLVLEFRLKRPRNKEGEGPIRKSAYLNQKGGK